MKDLIEALQIFLKYGNPRNPTICSHDELYINSEIEADKVSVEDIERLDELGFIIDEENNGFVSFRYGSA